jgi:hypothetical protein
MTDTAEKYYVDLDDFCESNNDFLLIVSLKKAVPGLKLNLFTIPGHCSNDFLKKIRQIEWLRLYPHGCYHKTSRECQEWNYETSINWLISLESTGWIKLWKSPGWQTSDDLFKALLERDWIIADQEYNNERRPKNLRAYLLDSPNKWHGHIGHWNAHNQNSLEYLFDYIATFEDGEFGFIDDLWN